MMPGIAVIAGQASEAGQKPHNEDACAIRIPEGQQLVNKGILLAVADGVSSSSAGREASESCITGLVTDYYSTPDSWTVRTSGEKVLSAINHWLFGQSQKVRYSGQGLLTTLSAVILKSTTAHIFHVGDSRICRIRDGEFEQLTRDHSRWGGKDRRFLSRAMGADIFVEIDYRKVDLEVGDVLILTTDGVHDYIGESEITELLKANEASPERVSRQLIELALERGSTDNVTCQICRITGLPDASASEFYRHLNELPFPPDLEAGMTIDGYQIVREIHASSRSQLYLAVDGDSGNRVVLKTPSRNYEDDEVYIDGFLSEEWVGKRISNPHVMKVINRKRHRHFLYYATEYIEGITLRQWMNDHPSAELSDVRNILSQLVKGVRAFQRLEMVHQDLKPENIMLDSQGTVKIIDFGSTRIAGVQEINKPIRRDVLLGTHDYAAPEYFLGQKGTHQSDIYSVAAIVYEMLCAGLPYGKPLTPNNLKRLAYQSARLRNEAIPLWVDAALEKGVRLDPARRYQALSEFELDLEKENIALKGAGSVSLLERRPVLFWKMVAIVLFCCNILLLYLLSINRI